MLTNHRIEKLQEKLREEKLDGAVYATSASLQYLLDDTTYPWQRTPETGFYVFPGTPMYSTERSYFQAKPDVLLFVPRAGAAPVLKELTDNGCRLILYSMRHGKLLDRAVEWFRVRGIPLYAVNENPSQKRWTSSPKIHADLYIDDCNLGCPLRFVDGEKHPVADWAKIREQLVREGFLD